ncbi:putative lipid II flippase FtsW [Paenibacillus sp. GCM10027626]|uniref:putative lipid II flippase FtsW n=1 Tax=Paenibacillus sp. GCM10027626 TaxID=3273411 RepID=UPI00363A0C93
MERRGRPDFLLLFVTLMLVCIGMIMVYSSSSPLGILKHNSSWYFVIKQGIFAVIGGGALLFFMGLPYQAWKKAAPFLLLFSLVTLVLVLFIGKDANGAKRWFGLGGFNFQPSEFTKLSIIVYLSTLISRKGERLRNFSKGLLPLLIIIGIILALVMKQPDFGTMLILFAISGTIIMVGGADWRHLLLISICLLPAIVYVGISKSYRMERITSFLNPFDDPTDSGFQLINSFYALGHGGFTGTGLGRSVQKLFYLPEAHTDFIFAVIGEEFGFLGTAALLMIFLLFIWRGFLAAVRCDNSFGMLLGIGIVIMIAVQLILNIGAVTGTLPITGVPLPFISYGGSSLVLCMASSGILLSISRDNKRKTVSPAKKSQRKIEVLKT